MNAERKVFYMNPLSPPIPKRLGGNDHFEKNLVKREAEWERKWNLAFSRKTPSIAKTDSLAKTKTVYMSWDNNSKRRDSLRIAEQLAPQNAKKVIETELSKSENVRKATEILERINRERTGSATQTPKSESTLATSTEKVVEDNKSKAKQEQRIPEIKTGSATWKNKNYDLPINIIGFAGEGPDGRKYVFIEESNAAIPLDEIEYPKEDVRTETVKVVEAPKPIAEEKQTPKPAEDEAKKKAEEEREKQKNLEEERLKGERFRLERAKREAEQKGKEIGKKEGKEELWTKLREKTNFFNKVKNLFKHHPKEPKTDQEKIDKYRRDIYRTIVLAGVGGALAALLGVGIAQHFGYFLPVPVRDLYINAYNNLVPFHK